MTPAQVARLALEWHRANPRAYPLRETVDHYCNVYGFTLAMRSEAHDLSCGKQDAATKASPTV